MKKRSGDYQKYLIESLKDPVEATNYLNAALEEKDDPQAFLVALRNVAEAQGMGKVAKAADLNRESFYRMLSDMGNPRFSSLKAVLGALGLSLRVGSNKISGASPLRR